MRVRQWRRWQCRQPPLRRTVEYRRRWRRRWRRQRSYTAETPKSHESHGRRREMTTTLLLSFLLERVAFDAFFRIAYLVSLSRLCLVLHRAMHDVIDGVHRFLRFTVARSSRVSFVVSLSRMTRSRVRATLCVLSPASQTMQTHGVSARSAGERELQCNCHTRARTIIPTVEQM